MSPTASRRESTPRLRVIEGIVVFWKGKLPKPPPFGGLLGVDRRFERRLSVSAVRALVVGLDHRSERRDALVAAEPHDDDALRRTAEPLHVLDGHADDRPA